MPGRRWPTVPEQGPVATALLETAPDWIAPRHRPRYALLVRDVASHPDLNVAAQGMWMLSSWVQLDETSTLVALAADRATDLDSARLHGLACRGRRPWPGRPRLGADVPLLDAARRSCRLTRPATSPSSTPASESCPLASASSRWRGWCPTRPGCIPSNATTARALELACSVTAVAGGLAVAPALEAVPWAVPPRRHRTCSTWPASRPDARPRCRPGRRPVDGARPPHLGRPRRTSTTSSGGWWPARDPRRPGRSGPAGAAGRTAWLGRSTARGAARPPPPR